MSTPANSAELLPSLPPADFAAWRQRLAGLVDPDYIGDDSSLHREHRRWAVDLGLLLCDVFSPALDRVTLWDRIGSALRTAAAKCDDGDIDRLLSLAAEHVQADDGRVGAHPDTHRLLLQAQSATLAWRQSLVRYLASHVPAVLALTRQAWEQAKTERKDARVLREGGVLSTGEIVSRGGDR